MHAVEQKIIQQLAGNPSTEFSTSQLVRRIFSAEYEEAKKYEFNEQNDKELEKLGRRKKARLHRKLLYHLSKLVSDEILRVTRVEGKGEKYFSLNPEKELLNKKDAAVKKVISSISSIHHDSPIPLSGLETFEEAKMIKRFDQNNWVSKINALIVESDARPDLGALYMLITEIYSSFNDVIGINGFESVIEREGLHELTSFIKKIDIDTKDYNKYVNLLVKASNVKNQVKLSDFMAALSTVNPERIHVIFQTNSRTLSHQSRSMKQTIKNFSAQKIRVNIQNTDIKKAPYMIGRAGAYTISDSEWEKYEEELKGKTIGLCFSETSLYVDVHRVFREKKSLSDFREFLLKSARALLMATTMQRKKSDSYFKTLNSLNGEYQNAFFSYSYNYIRLWNYDLSVDGGESFEMLESLLKSCADELGEFCKSEETIFKSCGIPIRFRVVLSSAFKRFDKDFLSPRIYKKVTIKNIHDFQSEELLGYVRKREALYNIFKGGDRVRFFRAPNFSAEEVISEFNFLLNGFNIPLFAYDFKPRVGALTLDSFLHE